MPLTGRVLLILAAFSDDSETFRRVDWRLLQNGPVNLYWRPAYIREDVQWLEEHGYIVHHFDVAAWTDEEIMHEEFQSKLNFPSYY